uniref:PH domain-containing protein n=1 Tax=Compsopogon caeruleus TaxID=31354 RepID=A0A7S1TAW3_9RHOD
MESILGLFELEVQGAQFLFASEETNGVILLAAHQCSMGLIRKLVKVGFKAPERINQKEIRFNLDSSRIYCVTRDALSEFKYGEQWLNSSGDRDPEKNEPFVLMTSEPLSLTGLQIQCNRESDGLPAKPTILSINTDRLFLDSAGGQFRVFVNVITKVLMKRHPLNEDVQKELSSLKYKLQLAGVRRPSKAELNLHSRRLRSIIDQLDFAIDTGRAKLVEDFLPPRSPSESETIDDLIRATRNKYIAKLNAVTVYLRKEYRIETDFYPTMFLSYSFDEVKWKLRENDKPIAEVRLLTLVFRHVFYVGRVQHQEFTFRDIVIANMMDNGYFRTILKAQEPTSVHERNIRSSDGTSVLFQWHAMQKERVGGIGIYENLTMHMAPLNVAFSMRLIDSFRAFLFPDQSEGSSQQKPKPSSNSSRRGAVASLWKNRGSALGYVRTTEEEVEDMSVRGSSTVFFKYIYVGPLRLTLSFKFREDDKKRGFLDVSDLNLVAPSRMYSSRTWTWKNFFDQVKKDFLVTVALRGASNFARTKVLRMSQKEERVMWKDYYEDIVSSGGQANTQATTSESGSSDGEDAAGQSPSSDSSRRLPESVDLRTEACLDILFGHQPNRPVLPEPSSLAPIPSEDRKDFVDADWALNDEISSQSSAVSRPSLTQDSRRRSQ